MSRAVETKLIEHDVVQRQVRTSILGKVERTKHKKVSCNPNEIVSNSRSSPQNINNIRKGPGALWGGVNGQNETFSDHSCNPDCGARKQQASSTERAGSGVWQRRTRSPA